MKKIVVLWVGLFMTTGLWAQTYNQSQMRADLEIAKLEKRLSEIKERIFYLEVTLNKVKRLNPIQEKQKFFADEDVKTLRTEKDVLEKSIIDIKKTELAGKDYRLKADVTSNTPEQMGPSEYRRRSRTQIYKMSEGAAGEVNPKGFKGIVVNYKTGPGEIATFHISRTDIGDTPGTSLVLNPGEKKEWSLPVGNYVVLITCGGYCKAFPFSVDPRATKWFDGQSVYWATYKAISDN
ncbi:MAG: hypothetical protein WCK59_00250 [Candidatus Falkowbacteria bacterium]